MFDDVEKSEVSEVESPREIVNSVQRTVTEVSYFLPFFFLLFNIIIIVIVIILWFDFRLLS
jgi:hypothetical protein